MLQGQLVNIAILLQWKYPILVNVKDQNITRRAGIPVGVIFSVQNYLSTNCCKEVFFQEANSKITFPWGDSSSRAAVQYLQGRQRRLAVVHGISKFWENSELWNMVGLCEPSWLIQGWLKYSKALKHVA